jgi:hypothetical protein
MTGASVSGIVKPTVAGKARAWVPESGINEAAIDLIVYSTVPV